jgi:hypothetical protein
MPRGSNVRRTGVTNWLQAAGEEGIILFEKVAKPAVHCRTGCAGYFYVVDRLENDGAFAQRILDEIRPPTS